MEGSSSITLLYQLNPQYIKELEAYKNTIRELKYQNQQSCNCAQVNEKENIILLEVFNILQLPRD